MKLITRQSKVKGAIQSFLNNYPQYNKSNSPFYTKERYNKVVALDPDTATPEDVEMVLNPSWVQCMCYECGCCVDAVVQMGQEPDYESIWVEVCKGCLQRALGMVG
jgi:Pyruvate/2-oxoacid:ferredoxin oxidoreductase delta subunit